MNLDKHFLVGLFLISLVSCINEPKKEKEKTLNDYVIESMLKPTFDESKIHGLGILKIGKSVDSTINYLLSTKNYILDSLSQSETEDDFYYSHVSNKSEKRKFIIPITESKKTFEAYEFVGNGWCKEKKIYWIPKYLIDSIEIENIRLTYYRNKLVFITCNSSFELLNAIKSKFGKPDEETDDSDVTFTKWNNDIITAGNYYYHSVDLKSTQFRLEIDGASDFIRDCDKTEFSLQDSILRGEQKAKLKNL